MPPNQEVRTALDKSGFGDLVNRDAYIRSRVHTGVGSVITNDFYFTDGTTPTHLAGEYVTYDSETKEAAYHIFAKGAGAETTLNTANTATALLSATAAKTTLRSTQVEVANQLAVIGPSTMADVSMTSFATNVIKPLGAGTTPLLVQTTGAVTFSSRQLNLDGNANTRMQFQETSKLSLYAAGSHMLDLDGLTQNVGISTANPGYKLDVAGDVNVSQGNVYRIGETSVLTNTALGTSVTVSSLTSVGTLGRLTVDASGEVRVGHVLHKAFSRTLGTTLGDAVDICSIQCSVFTLKVGVVQQQPSNALSKYYVASVYAESPGGGWRRVLPLSQTGDSSGNDFALEISVASNVATFRLLRTGVGTDTSANAVACHFMVHHTGAPDSVTFTDLSGNAALTGQALINSVYTQTLLTQSRGNVGVALENAAYPLDVSGDVNVNTQYRIGGTPVLSGTTLGSGVTVSSLTSVGTLGSLAVNGNVAVDGSTFSVNSAANRVGILTTLPASALDVAGDANSTNYRVGGTSVLTSTALGTTVTSSSLTSVGTLGTLTVENTGETRLGETLHRLFTRDLGTTLGDAVEVCSVAGATFYFKFVVIQNETWNAITKVYVGSVSTVNADGIWRRMLPFTQTGDTSGNDFAAEIHVSGAGTTTFRVLRTGVGFSVSANNVTCHLTVHQNGANPVTITDLSGNAALTGQSLTNVLYNQTLLTQSKGNVGISQQNAAYPLDVGGDVNVETGNVYRVGGTPVLSGTTLGSGVTVSSLTSVGTLGSLAVSGNVLVDGSTLAVDSVENRVGVLTTIPQYPMDVVGDVNLGSGNVYRIGGTSVLSGTALGTTVTVSSLTTVGNLGSLTVVGDADIDNNALRVDSSNNRVGINTNAPTQALDVRGSTIVSGNVNVTGLADVFTGANYAWTGRVSAADNAWRGVTWGNGLFVAVASSGTGNRVMTSPDGITWTARTSAADNDWMSVTWGNGLFVAVAASGTGNRVMTSPDGITWTIRQSAADIAWRSVTWGNGLFVAVAESGTGNRVMTSPDGITWTIRQSAADNNWSGITWGNGLFVAVSWTGGGNRVMTSPDGIIWTTRTTPVLEDGWRSVTYGNGLFVAVANNSRVMTSSDGITWIRRTSAANVGWWSVTYGNGLFVAVCNIWIVMTSPDGITWTARSGAASNNWWGVAYGDGRFVAVSDTGLGNRVMSWDVPTKNMVYYNADTGLLSRGAFDVPSARISGYLTVLEGANVSGPVTAASLTVSSNVQVNGNTFTANATQNRVGILTTSPEHTLDIAGDLNLATGNIYRNGNTSVLSSSTLGTTVTVSSLTSVGTLANLTVTNDLTVDTNTLRVDSTNDRVGVLTTSPQYPLDVSGNVNTTESYLIGGTPVLSATSLGTTISSAPGLTSIGTLGSLTVSGLFTAQSNVNFTGTTASFTVAGPSAFSDELTVNGNLTVNGTTTYLNSTTLQVDDKNLELGIDTADLPTLNGAGITLGAVGIGTARPFLEYTYNLGTDYWKSNIGIRGVGSTTYSAFEKDGTIKVARNDASGNFVSVDNEAINFSQKWRVRCDIVDDKMLLEQYDGGVWTTKFTFAAGT